MIRTKGEAGTGDVVHAVQHMRQITREMRALTVLREQELYAAAKEHQAPYELVRMVAQSGQDFLYRIFQPAELRPPPTLRS